MDNNVTLTSHAIHSDVVMGLTILSVFLFIIIILLVAFMFHCESTKVNKEECPTVEGDYGVKIGMSGVVLDLCGTDGKSTCTANASTLTDAEAYCLQNKGICEAFTFVQSASTSIVNIVDQGGNFTKNSLANTYIQQT